MCIMDILSFCPSVLVTVMTINVDVRQGLGGYNVKRQMVQHEVFGFVRQVVKQ